MARAFLDACITEHLRGELTVEKAAMCKYWLTDTQGEVLLRQPIGVPLEEALSYLSGGLRAAERMGAPARMILQAREAQNFDYGVYDAPTREQAYYALARAD